MYGTIRICIELLKRDRAIGRVMKLLGDLYYLAFFDVALCYPSFCH